MDWILNNKIVFFCKFHIFCCLVHSEWTTMNRRLLKLNSFIQSMKIVWIVVSLVKISFRTALNFERYCNLQGIRRIIWLVKIGNMIVVALVSMKNETFEKSIFDLHDSISRILKYYECTWIQYFIHWNMTHIHVVQPKRLELFK